VFKYKSISLLCVSYIHIQIKAWHALDLILLVVTNWSMRDIYIKSQFGPHIDTNYCVRRNFNKCLNISLFSPYMCHMFILKFDKISCPWFGLVGGYKSINERRSSQSWFAPHVDINYCACENFVKCVNISLCSPYMRHMFMPKFDNIMPLIWSCWWLQIGLWETLVSSHDSAST
jgi:hypothetical protein